MELVSLFGVWFDGIMRLGLRSNLWVMLSVFTVCCAWFFYFATDYISPGSSAVATAGFGAGGLLNPPSYPLFGCFSRIFNLLPIQSWALKANLMACFFGGLSGVALFALMQVWMSALLPYLDRINKVLLSLLAVLLWVTCPVAIGHFAAIEKYSIGIVFFQATFLYFSILLFRPLDQGPLRLGQVFCFGILLGLTVLAHYLYSSATLFFMAVLGIKYRRQFEWRWLPTLVLGLFTGLLPILYLPWASLQNPLLDWWNPETPEAIWQAVTRRQYRGSSIPLTPKYLISRLQWVYGLLWNQWVLHPVFLLVPALGYLVWRRRRDAAVLLLLAMLLPLTGEAVVVGVRNYDPNQSIPSLTAGFDRYNWSFYLQWLLVFIALSILCFARCLREVQDVKKQRGAILLAAFLLVTPSLSQRLAVGRIPAVLPEWTHNLQAVVQSGDTILVSFDALYFALFVAQNEGRFPKDVHVIHTSMMMMPWYQQTLAQMYPDWYPRIAASGEALKAVSQKSYQDPYNLALIQEWQGAAIPFVAAVIQASKSVLVISNSNLMPMNPAITAGFSKQSFLIGDWGFQGTMEMKDIPWSSWSFDETFKGPVREFPWLLAFRNALRSEWKKIAPLQKAAYPEDHESQKSFELLLNKDDGL